MQRHRDVLFVRGTFSRKGENRIHSPTISLSIVFSLFSTISSPPIPPPTSFPVHSFALLSTLQSLRSKNEIEKTNTMMKMMKKKKTNTMMRVKMRRKKRMKEMMKEMMMEGREKDSKR